MAAPSHRHAAHAADISSALKELHRALIRGEIGDDPSLDNPYTMLFALIGDPRFAWMKGLSELIARIDGAADDEALAEAGGFETMRDEAAALLGEGPIAPDSAFRLRYLVAVQKEPAVGLAAGRLRRALAATRGVPR